MWFENKRVNALKEIQQWLIRYYSIISNAEQLQAEKLVRYLWDCSKEGFPYTKISVSSPSEAVTLYAYILSFNWLGYSETGSKFCYLWENYNFNCLKELTNIYQRGLNTEFISLIKKYYLTHGLDPDIASRNSMSHDCYYRWLGINAVDSFLSNLFYEKFSSNNLTDGEVVAIKEAVSNVKSIPFHCDDQITNDEIKRSQNSIHYEYKKFYNQNY